VRKAARNATPAVIRNAERGVKIFARRSLNLLLIGVCASLTELTLAQSPCTGLEDCLKDLKSSDASVKSGAIFMLGTLNDKRATPALMGLLTDEHDFEIRSSAVKAIGSLHDPRAVPGLTGLLDDKGLQLDAIDALVKIADKSAVEALIQGLKQPEIQVAAVRGLGEIADPSAKPALTALWRQTDNERVRGLSGLAIQRINSIWGPTEGEMGIPRYPKSEFMPNARGEWIFVSEDPLPKVSDFFKRHLKKEPLTFQGFRERYENELGETKEGPSPDQPNLIFVAEEQQFQGRSYPAKLIFLQANKSETEIRIFRTIGAPD